MTSDDGRQRAVAARLEATRAIQLAARSLAVEPAELGAATYRAFCAREAELRLPSWLTISVLFAGWQRACEQVSALSRDEADVEPNAIRMLYGDPSRCHLLYATSSHEQTRA
jgi:hypothetical protein